MSARSAAAHHDSKSELGLVADLVVAKRLVTIEVVAVEHKFHALGFVASEFLKHSHNFIDGDFEVLKLNFVDLVPLIFNVDRLHLCL